MPSDPSSHLANELVRLGSLPVLLTGVAVIFVVAIFRDWVRAFACASAPIVAVEVVEHIAKPMVGRQIGAGSFTYPSGTVAAVAALATAVFLVSPRLLRPLSAVGGALAVAAVGAAVLVLRWHYPTDVIGGVWVGSGAVFLIGTRSRMCPGFLPLRDLGPMPRFLLGRQVLPSRCKALPGAAGGRLGNRASWACHGGRSRVRAAIGGRRARNLPDGDHHGPALPARHPSPTASVSQSRSGVVSP